MHRCYLPYDTSFAIKRFINFYKPKLGLIIEKELWPNLINQCNLNKLPAILINGRLSNKSLKKYLLFKGIFNNLLVQLNSIYVQNEHDRLNFKKITQAKINTMGNLKFDVRPPSNIYAQIKELKSQLKIKKQYVIVAGSTRNGEEKIILKFILKLKLKNFVLIIVPRHPERFDEVAKIFKSQNILYSRRSEYQDIQKSPQFIIGDSMGELYQYYGLANLAIIGGSILDYGGQNLIEPLSMNVPTAIGPSIYNFKNITEAAEKEKAIIRFKKINDLRDIINDLLISKIYANKLIKNTKTFMLQSRGGTEEVIKIINRYF
jgi:3-deoxy-D-manno-octulosonic-acid transferase